MESAGSHHYGPYDLGLEDLIRPSMAAAEAASDDGWMHHTVNPGVGRRKSKRVYWTRQK